MFLPASGANVSWGIRNGWETGINYRGNFFPLSGVSVDNRIVWNSSSVPLASSIATGAVVTIAEGASGTLIIPANISVTIESRDMVSGGGLGLNIGANSTAIWRADYTLSGNVWNSIAIWADGTGTFNVVQGNINNNSIGGGSNHSAIGGWQGNIVVSGGIVSLSSPGTAISNSNGTVTVSGGEVRATPGTAINAQNVTVSGGVVSATTGQAINANAAGTFNVTGGLVIAQRNTLIGNNGVVSRQPNAVSGNGTIVGYTCGGQVAIGSSTNLVSEPANVASWGINAGQARINSPGGFHQVSEGCVTFPSATVTFNLNGATGTPPNPVTVIQGETLTSLPTASWTGRNFVGWFTSGGSQVTTSMPINNDMTVWARWSLITYNITYIHNNENNDTTRATFNVASQSITLPTLTRDGYFFSGWFTNSNFTEWAVTIIPTGSTGDRMFWARWLPAFTITFDPNGGTVNPTFGTTAEGGRLTYLPTSTKDGHTFTGWFTDSVGGIQITTNTEFNADDIIFAQWVIGTNIVEAQCTAPLQVYPNPVTGQLRIVHDWQMGDVVELFDMNGRRVFSQRVAVEAKCILPLQSNIFTIDMSPFPNGNYILRIGNHATKIVKQ